MDTLERKSSNDATFLNCFWRSVVFKTMSLLNKSDSPMLFYKTYGIFYLIMMAVSALTSLASGESFGFGFMCEQIIYAISDAIISALSTFFICFILNLFMADNFMRIVNVFTFSGVHNWFLSFFVVIYFKYKKYSEKICSDHELLQSIIKSYLSNDENIWSEQQQEVVSAIKEFFMAFRNVSILRMFTFIAFIILLIRNIRALRRK